MIEKQLQKYKIIILNRFNSVNECILYYREIDNKKTVKEFPNRYRLLKKQMLRRKVPKEQFEQLKEIYSRYEKEYANLYEIKR